ncbi:phosphoglycerate kinase [Candidatus Giovannonibacteria bacterium]|nr:phosphoglycerate kinase [Candidatus Giovannonibacteria bacterium]
MSRILLRVDFNNPYEYRINATLPTIRALLKKGHFVTLITHFEKDGKYPHLDQIARYLKKYFPSLVFIKGEIKKADPLIFSKQSKLFLLDNLRLSKGETSNDIKFARILASWGDFYINEAFAVSHRKHTSLVGLPKLLPHEMGPLFKSEVHNLSKFFKPRHPFLFVLGGKKFETKEPLIKKFLRSADAIFVGGMTGNTFLAYRGIGVGKSFVEKVKIPENILWSPKIFLPEDWESKNEIIYDAGLKTIKSLKGLAVKAKFVLWNGTFGWVEGGYEKGTRDFARALGKSKAFRVIGGGDTVDAIRRYKLEKNFDFISTGGGAMLEFLAKGTLPGIEALKKK